MGKKVNMYMGFISMDRIWSLASKCIAERMDEANYVQNKLEVKNKRQNNMATAMVCATTTNTPGESLSSTHNFSFVRTPPPCSGREQLSPHPSFTAIQIGCTGGWSTCRLQSAMKVGATRHRLQEHLRYKRAANPTTMRISNSGGLTLQQSGTEN